ncbi:site-specific DNA-methyltransferase [Promethearchaeum syntrophicum]|uniref:Site-specific DNA-methyltransferase n=1 Tax=Promethearchaeum syntrophicum TaxID=2594042 RepID=A0A5B9D650_9ARCH|nr:site-specific DNA-methyltransferase [Candidatus Prometheoarchaeum syntrophicum]QEE14599.1 putative methyltransferase [Candidatus Prometheoarchaeum syntrophicum]
MGDSNFLSFSFPFHTKENIPELNWVNRPINNFQVPKTDIKPVLVVDSAKILTNLGKIQLNSAKNDQNINFYSSYEEVFKKDREDNTLNRIIHADSLIGMANLIENGFREKTQMIYFDPPFGIEFNAKFHSGNQKTEGYIDSWKNGLNSYLEYLRERIFLCRELLNPSGSIFIQIGDENVHYVRCLMDEIFGRKNFVSQITFRTAISTNKINSVSDYLLWYARDKSKMFRRKLYCERSEEKSSKTFTYSDTNPKSGKIRKFKAQELVNRIKPTKSLRIDRNYSIDFKGKKFLPPEGFEWRWNKDALQRLIELNRIHEINGKLYGKRYGKDFPVMILTNLWTDTSTSTFASRKHYTVHTNPKVIRRCIAMTTKPGDLVLDPTSGSGTTAVVAEDLFRKWIVFDTSPTSILSTFNWLIGTNFPEYQWDDSIKDFIYTQVNKVSLSNLAHKRTSNQEFQYDLPKKEKKNRNAIRIASPFSIEMIKKLKISKWAEFIVSILKNNGILLPSGKKIALDNIQFLEIPGNKDQNRTLSIVRGTIRELIYNVIINDPTAEISESDILKVLEIPDEPIRNQNWIILGGVFSFKFYRRIKEIRELLEKSETTLQKVILLGNYHPDLLIKQLSFDAHPESIRIMGSIIQKPKDLKFTIQFYNPFSNMFEKLPDDQIAVWMICNLKNDEKKPPKIDLIQCPIYKNFISKIIKPYFCSTIELNQYIKQYKNQIEESKIGLIGIDLRGTPHYAILGR